MDSSRAKLPVIMSTLEYYDSRIKTHIANQINTTAPKSHKHAIADVTGLQAALDALGSNSSTETSSALEEAKQFTLTKIAELVNGADSSLDTLKELADAMTNNKSLIEALDTAIGKKANASDLTSHTSNKSNPHGVTLAQLGVTATAAELNILDGVTVTASKINYLTDVTSNIQAQLNGKAASSHGTHVSFSTTVPVVAGTAAVGTATTVSRSDHVHPAQTTVSGNAGSATVLQVTRAIDGVNFNGGASITHYGTCSTAAATAAKTVALTGFTLVTGAIVFVKFTVTNTVASPTLNVNSTGAKAIMYRGSAISAGYLAANRVYAFIYDGTDWELVGDINTNTTYSAATTSASGLMSAADKGKLDGLPSSAAVIKVLTSENLDDVTTPGFYQSDSGNTCTNKPYNVDHFGLYVIQLGPSGYYSQILTGQYTSVFMGSGIKHYRRQCKAGVWSDWTEDVFTDTHFTAKLIAGASATASANAAASNGSVYLNLIENTSSQTKSIRSSHLIKGTGGTTVTSDADGVITISGSYLPLSGGTMTGVATGYANTSYTTAQFRNITMSTSSPSGGSNGQIHFQYS